MNEVKWAKIPQLEDSNTHSLQLFLSSLDTHDKNDDDDDDKDDKDDKSFFKPVVGAGGALVLLFLLWLSPVPIYFCSQSCLGGTSDRLDLGVYTVS